MPQALLLRYFSVPLKSRGFRAQPLLLIRTGNFCACTGLCRRLFSSLVSYIIRYRPRFQSTLGTARRGGRRHREGQALMTVARSRTGAISGLSYRGCQPRAASLVRLGPQLQGTRLGSLLKLGSASLSVGNAVSKKAQTIGYASPLRPEL